MVERAVFLRPEGLSGVEALHARFVEHAYLPHSHPTWTVAVMRAGAARFEVGATRQRADRGELFVLEPEAVHTGMAAVPVGWGYQVLYLDPAVVHEWAERDQPAPRAARWVVFRDPAVRAALVPMHAAFAADAGGLAAFAGLSRFELVRRFREQTGLTPHAYGRLMAVSDFDTKAAVIVRDDLAAWQRLNVCAFLMSGVTGAAGPEAIGETASTPTATATCRCSCSPCSSSSPTGAGFGPCDERAARREVPVVLHTAAMFATGNDRDNRAVVRSVAAGDLDIVGIALRAPHRDADAILRGLSRHP